jgi:aspartyl-tRNA(Asn)/glutamyl-tRNA(Gln) amidotransferase subunit C
MAEAITAAIFDHLVELAALELEPKEAEYLRAQLNSQLKAIRELEAIEVGPEVGITSHGVPYTPEISAVPREDSATPSDLADAILKQAPEVDGRYLVVPDIPHTDLT